MTHEELDEAVALYAVGALDRAERQLLEAHLLSGCSSCHASLKEYQAVATLLPFGLPLSSPPRALKTKIMAARTPAIPSPSETVKEPGTPSLEPGEWMNHLFPPITPTRSLPFRFAMGFAALAIVAVTGYVGWSLYSRVATESGKVEQLQTALQKDTTKLASFQRELSERETALGRLRQELQQRNTDIQEFRDIVIQREAELDDLRNQLALLEKASSATRKGRSQQDELATLLRAPDVRVVTLAGSSIAKGASGLLLYDPHTKKAWLYAVNLPECPSGTIYQVWGIDEKPVSVDTFHIDTGQTAHLLSKRLPDFPRMKQFAVSLEPVGGRPQPTGAIYLQGQL
ncbi:MAG: anti-sigma factor domain-containing protein [Nitrospiraceae bacterium]